MAALHDSPRGFFAIVVDARGCALSRAFFVAPGGDPKAARQVSGGYLQLIARSGLAASPPIRIENDIGDEDSDLFEIIHNAYERFLDTPDQGGSPIAWDRDVLNNPPISFAAGGR